MQRCLSDLQYLAPASWPNLVSTIFVRKHTARRVRRVSVNPTRRKDSLRDIFRLPIHDVEKGQSMPKVMNANKYVRMKNA